MLIAIVKPIRSLDISKVMKLATTAQNIVATMDRYKEKSIIGLRGYFLRKGIVKIENTAALTYKANASMFSCVFVMPSSQLKGCVITAGRKNSTESPSLKNATEISAKQCKAFGLSLSSSKDKFSDMTHGISSIQMIRQQTNINRTFFRKRGNIKHNANYCNCVVRQCTLYTNTITIYILFIIMCNTVELEGS